MNDERRAYYFVLYLNIMTYVSSINIQINFFVSVGTPNIIQPTTGCGITPSEYVYVFARRDLWTFGPSREEPIATNSLEVASVHGRRWSFVAEAHAGLSCPTKEIAVI